MEFGRVAMDTGKTVDVTFLVHAVLFGLAFAGYRHGRAWDHFDCKEMSTSFVIVRQYLDAIFRDRVGLVMTSNWFAPTGIYMREPQ